MTFCKSSYHHCQKIVRDAHSNFTPAFRLLPTQKRAAMEILYAWMRYTDDISDDVSGNIQTPLARLNSWENASLQLWDFLECSETSEISKSSEFSLAESVQRFPDHPRGAPILPAMLWLVKTFNVPHKSFAEVIGGCRRDLSPQRFSTFAESAEYCHLVASSVGQISLAIWGFSESSECSEKSLENRAESRAESQVISAAKNCGLAFQWTNILRDLCEDARRGRLYLPLDELTECGWSEEEFLQFLQIAPPRIDAQSQKKFALLLARQFACGEEFFQSAATLFPIIERDSQRLFGAMWSAYYKIFRKMQANPNAILQRRVSLSLIEKIFLALRWRFGILKK